jgi:hypothetical protein
MVAEPHLSPWAEADIDHARPLESLARKAFAMYDTGPLQYFVQAVIRPGAQEYEVDGTIYWARVGCRQTCATIRILKDTLMQEVGIPTLVIDYDVAGPTYVLAEQMQRNAGETGRVS